MKKNLLALSLGAAMVAGAAVPAFADHTECASIDDVVANHIEDGNSVETVEYYPEEENASGTKATSVYAVIGSNYKVTIPKVIILSGIEKKADFYVKVAGDIAGNEKVIIRPITPTFNLYSANKAPQVATVTLDDKIITLDEFDQEKNGLIKADGLTSGKWEGICVFEIGLTESDSEEDNVAGAITIGTSLTGNQVTIPNVSSWADYTVIKKGLAPSVLEIVLDTDYGEISQIYKGSTDVTDSVTLMSFDPNIVRIDGNKILPGKINGETIVRLYHRNSPDKVNYFNLYVRNSVN